MEKVGSGKGKMSGHFVEGVSKERPSSLTIMFVPEQSDEEQRLFQMA